MIFLVFAFGFWICFFVTAGGYYGIRVLIDFRETYDRVRSMEVAGQHSAIDAYKERTEFMRVLHRERTAAILSQAPTSETSS